MERQALCTECGAQLNSSAGATESVICPDCRNAARLGNEHQVFISYCSEDLTVAETVRQELENRGIPYWFAPRDELAATDFAAQIDAALRLSAAVLLIHSSNANGSDWVRREVRCALDQVKIPVIVLKLDTSGFCDGLNIRIGGDHYINVAGKPLKAHLDSIVRAVRDVLNLTGESPLPTDQSFDIGEKPPHYQDGIERRPETYAPHSTLDEWVSALTNADERERVLVIHGPSGRGKSFAAKQLRRRLINQNSSSLHFWLDCGHTPPRGSDIARLFAFAVPEPEREAFIREFPATFAPAAFAAEGPGSELPGADFLRHLRGNRTRRRPCYLYLDDLDHALTELTSPRSFIHGFLGALTIMPELRVVVTSKTDELDGIIRGVLDSSHRGAVSVRTTELAPFEPSDTDRFLSSPEHASLGLASAEFATISRATQGEPLFLRLMVDLLHGIRITEASPAKALELQTALLGQISEHYRAFENGTKALQLRKKDLQRDLRGLLFRYQISRLGNEPYEILLAIAVLTYDYARASFAVEGAVRAVAARISINDHLEVLRNYRVITGSGLRLDLDAARDFLYQYGRLEGKAALAAHKKLISDLHARAASYYKGQPGGESMAVWHSARAGQGKAALRLLTQVSPSMEASFQFADLMKLRKTIRTALLPNRHDGDLLAENDAQIAEICYQGFDNWDPGEEHWQMAAQVVANYQGAGLSILTKQLDADERLLHLFKPMRYTHENVLAYAQACLMLTVIAFEAKPTSWSSLASDAEAILAFVDHHIKDDAFRATVLSNLGIFRNRGAQIEAAEAAYTEALNSLARVDHPVPSVQSRLIQDRLRIAVNRSRTRFLAEDGGSREAINALAPSISEFGIAGTQEYLYGCVNLAYYSLGLGEVQAVRDLVKACKKERRTGANVNDDWIFGCVSALSAALLLYDAETQAADGAPGGGRQGYAAARQAFEKLSNTFDSPRDEILMAINARIVDLALLIQSAAHMTPDDVCDEYRMITRTLRTLLVKGRDGDGMGVSDEPIANETIAYLLHVIPPELERRLGVELPDPPKLAELPDLTRLRTELRFAPLIYLGMPGESRTLWHLPILMRGALILRSRPLAPLASEFASVERT